jgi:hypothetical protein
MRLPGFSILGKLAIAGIILFAVVNWWPSIVKTDESNVLSETDPAISKQTAAAAAESFVAGLGGGSVRSTFVVYESDSLMSGYIQREALVKAYKAHYSSKVPIDYYRVELTTDRNKEYWVDVDMTKGGVIGWQLRSREAAPPREQGRRLAEASLSAAGLNAADYTLLPPDPSKPQQYVFEHRTEKLGDAALQTIVEVRGGRVTMFRPAFAVPDEHRAWVAAQDRATSEMTLWNMVATVLMGIAAVVLAIVYRKRIAFARGAFLIAAFLLLYWINNANMFPAFKTLAAEGADPFETSEAAAGFVIVMNAVAALMAVAGYFSLAAGQSLWQKQGMRLWPRWREPSFGRETLIGMCRGYLLACLMLGIQSLLFFVAEQRFGMWAARDPSGSLYNLLQPALFPLMAWSAAISEEAIYRFFGIALFKQTVRNTLLAVLIPSVIWALSHTQYPIYPVYTRLVEVTILGIVFGYAFLKYGFIAALFAHAIMDSMLMSFSLMDMGGAGNIALGCLYIALPALIGLLLWQLHKLGPGRHSIAAGGP